MSNQNNKDEIQAERLERYEERQKNRLERYEALADKAQEKSTSFATRSNKMAECIPFGQPILVGHHSEKADRNFRAKIHSTMGKAVQESEKAEYYRNKADSVGKGGISSDDPNAIAKLKDKLLSLQQRQERMKLANKLIKKHSDQDARLKGLIDLGFTEELATEVLNPKYGVIGFASYTLQNNNAEISRLKKRITQLEAVENRESQEVESELYKYKECKIENRCMFTFDGKPTEEIRQTLKSNGFKWSPSRGAWVRQLNANGIYASKQVMKNLDK
ncbi:DUF3560 domain-containing protein [Acinetobacter baumannii]|uniref:DUF3560 domain-containing protein n=1 Tax=Acinetobacter baumannii TaxID=470 RepID=UPI002AB486B3|nr:DUF3560 domain-containing protein [Acinetobacter baumannii]MDY7730044.1 DUF3560 domain-containing protein [Acinetobacter baumannii]